MIMVMCDKCGRSEKLEDVRKTALVEMLCSDSPEVPLIPTMEELNDKVHLCPNCNTKHFDAEVAPCWHFGAW